MLSDINAIEATKFTLHWLHVQRHLEQWANCGGGRFHTESTDGLGRAIRAALWELKLAHDFDQAFDLEGASLELERLTEIVHHEFTSQQSRCPVCPAHGITPE